ncbi:MAG: TetR/AcrR family transcriptional regulator [Treponema sp.]|jgi:AcrR family transcriptional regulator|nr:TetR/AcrR family transcriptional regulator [Treponema sp.]
MAITVEHNERRKSILEKALTVFIDDGFEGTTFQKIADRCGITRTILYLYFKNKREIFIFSIKQLLLSVEENINTIRASKSLNSADKITKVLYTIFKLLEQNQQMLSVILDYLLHVLKSDVNPETRVRRRTVRLRHMLSSMLIEGIKAGEFKKVNVKTTNDYLYSFIEAAIFQLVILKRKDFTELKEAAAFAVRQLSV